MKKLLFVIFTENFSWGVSILASLAQKLGWEVDVLFLSRQEDTSARFISHTENFRPNMVAVSFMSYDRRQALIVARCAKQMGIKIIAGGVHSTFLPKDLITTGLFDAIVVGDGMGVWESLLDNFHRLEDNFLIQGKRHEDRSLYTELFQSSSQIERMKRTKSAMLLSSQGCPYKCRFCASGSLDYIGYKAGEIVSMMDQLHTRYDVHNFHFFDDLFAITERRCRRIRLAVLNHFGQGTQIRFGNFVQARTNTFNESIAEELVKMGVGCVNFGIETASNKLLIFLNKKQTQEDCYNAMRICKEFGLIRKVNLMFGIPTQDHEDYEITRRFIEETHPEIVTCFFFVPLPGSDLYDYCFNQGYLPDGYDRDRFDWFNDQPDGFVEIQCRLKNVDYNMAIEYKDRIEKLCDQLGNLLPHLCLLDRQPWVIIGTSKTYYFKRFMEKLTSIKLSNCLGYIDLEEGSGFSIHKSANIAKYNLNSTEKPQVCVTYCYKDGEDFNFMQQAVKHYFGNLPLISLASYKNHSVNDIKRLTQTI